MTTTPEALDLHPVPHPALPVRQAGFPLDHPYLEHCLTPIVGPSSILLLRRCVHLWRDAAPARVPTHELAGMLGLGRGTAASSPIWHTLQRVVRFRDADMPAPAELHVYTEVAPLSQRQLERVPAWCRQAHETLLGQHLDGLARATSQTPPTPLGPAHMGTAERLQRLTNHPPTLTRRLSP